MTLCVLVALLTFGVGLLVTVWFNRSTTQSTLAKTAGDPSLTVAPTPTTITDVETYLFMTLVVIRAVGMYSCGRSHAVRPHSGKCALLSGHIGRKRSAVT